MTRLARLLLLAALGMMTASGLNATPLEAAAKREAAPTLSLKDLSGRVHRVTDYRGQVLVVNFWATWCPPCREEMPSLNRAAKALVKEGVQFVAVNIGETAEAIQAFTKRQPVEVPILLDASQNAVRRWPVLGLPTTVVVDPRGEIAFHVTGDREWDDPEILRQLRDLTRRSGA